MVTMKLPHYIKYEKRSKDNCKRNMQAYNFLHHYVKKKMQRLIYDSDCFQGNMLFLMLKYVFVYISLYPICASTMAYNLLNAGQGHNIINCL